MMSFYFTNFIQKFRVYIKNFFKENIKPYIKENGLIFISVPGVKKDYDNVPEDLSKKISEDDLKNLERILKQVDENMGL